MNLRLLRLGLVCLLATAAVPFAAQASEFEFTLSLDGCTGTCGIGPYATVTITDEGSGAGEYVLVTETLDSPDEFVKTGAGDALEFQLSTAATSIKDLTTGFSLASGKQSASTFGSFSNGVICSGCGNGASKPLAGPISFEVFGVTTADFVANSDGNYFASDIIGSNGKTGNVANDAEIDMTGLGGGSGTGTPEPGSLFLLLGGALLFLLIEKSGLRDKLSAPPGGCQPRAIVIGR